MSHYPRLDATLRSNDEGNGDGGDAPPAAVLLERVKQRDTAALGALYDLYAPRVRSYALHLLRDAHAAEDIAHEVFVRVWRYAATYDASKSPRPEAWIFQIARNQAINEMGARSRTLSVEAINQAAEQGQGFPILEPQQTDSTPDWTECQPDFFQKSIRSLPSNYRQVMFLRFQHELSNPEIAEHLGVPIGTVKTWLRRSLIQLRSDLRVQAVSASAA